ncbi:MAG TPA: ADP-glyceromanno-heptose 6-epimerase [Planctomycetota bacterium]|nr:ADP-glyceromanno-heptose 6-epimerase [Planctomycetota bacterium]
MYIVTGGAGFIGSNLVRGLNLRGTGDVLIVDDLTNGEKHLGLNGLDFVDLVDHRDFLAGLDAFEPGDVAAVFHQGACSDTTERDGRYMLSVNYEFSKRLLAWSLGRCPFLYASSAAVYGDGSAGFREEPGCEWPLNVYGFSKLVFDQHVRRLLPSAPTQVAGLRYFNVYGPQENHKGRMASLVYKLHGQAAAGGDLTVFEGSDDFRRDFVHVDDAVAVNLFLLDHAHVSGVFNCGTGRAESFRHLADCTASHLPGAKVREVPFPDDLQGKYQAFTQADLTRLRAAGYAAPFRSLEEGVADYVRVLTESGGYHRRAQA